ncbi:hypothetical protein JRQ81_008998 [Phrynocephalus forsythii]|uniref:Hydroxysteroid 11-beta-dehydrogenase 1-like protein n=1 Tax=Phrynocephalus forsythii TaxID=171643 RepID=A0A9Q1AT59_9SAUR|nr:hypothetical protein JRQ81_008998 [Phrynocephalus forsythii]
MRVLRLALCSLAIAVVWVAFSWRDTFDPESLSGARVLVTGASTGIGEQVAYHYARFGAEVVLTARRASVLEKPSLSFSTPPGGREMFGDGCQKAFIFPADMASPAEPEKLVHFALEKLGGLDYVVLNHIGWTPFTMWSGDVAHVRWLTEVNFLSYVAITSAALPALTESKGCIIVLSSLTGRIATPFTASYSATKFALEGFFGSLRNELAMQRKDVCVTVCVLGLIDTESALNKTRDVVDMKAAPVSETALAIVKAGATRTMELFYPWTVQLLCLIRDWFPEQRDAIMRGFYHYHPPDA